MSKTTLQVFSPDPVHRERFERLEECNAIIAKEYRQHNADLDAMQAHKKEFNKELDATISMLMGIDAIEGELAQMEANSARIMQLLAKVGIGQHT